MSIRPEQVLVDSDLIVRLKHFYPNATSFNQVLVHLILEKEDSIVTLKDLDDRLQKVEEQVSYLMVGAGYDSDD